MSGAELCLRGVIEGFYGREWDWAARRAYAGYLQALGLNAYIYAPKSDAHLRKQWQRPWPAERAAALAELAEHYRSRGLSWGVGLSPFALYQQYDGPARRALRERVAGIDALGGDVLALLFDDMPGDIHGLAARQADIVADVRAWTNADHLIVCPTYYSTDPVLERFFGAMPARYWEDLGVSLDAAVDVFWTGPAVCPPEVRADDLETITALLQRRPVLWDNYPVNDGEKASRYLHLEPLPGRSPDLPAALRGHFCNPMNQAYLSRYPLGGLAALYGGRCPPLNALFSPQLAACLARDQHSFQYQGLDAMDPDDRRRLADEYTALGEEAALEVAGWLRDEYRFDPACLTG